MNWIVSRIKLIMLFAGVLTCSMLYALIAPHAAFLGSFGEQLDGTADEIVVRNWGALIGLIGAMLIYGAFHPTSRRLVLTIAGASKIIFICLMFSYGARYLSHQAGIAVVTDSLFVILFAAYLLAPTRARVGNT